MLSLLKRKKRTRTLNVDNHNDDLASSKDVASNLATGNESNKAAMATSMSMTTTMMTASTEAKSDIETNAVKLELTAMPNSNKDEVISDLNFDFGDYDLFSFSDKSANYQHGDDDNNNDDVICNGKQQSKKGKELMTKQTSERDEKKNYNEPTSSMDLSMDMTKTKIVADISDSANEQAVAVKTTTKIRPGDIDFEAGEKVEVDEKYQVKTDISTSAASPPPPLPPLPTLPSSLTPIFVVPFKGEELEPNDSIEVNDAIESQDELLVQFLDQANLIAEARLAARRQARAEAREIRMREVERQQKEQEQNADRAFDMHAASNSSLDTLTRSRLTSGTPISSLLSGSRLTVGQTMSSRRSSEDSLEEEGRSLRDIRHELKDVEDRFRKAMIANAQLDNDRCSQSYEVKLLKDKMEIMRDGFAQLQRELKEKTRDCNGLKRNLERITLELKLVQGQLNERDTLIAEQGLVIVAIENSDGTDAKRALVSVENANVLASVQGSLDVRLKKFNEERQYLIAEIQKLQEQVEGYKKEGKTRSGNSTNGPLGSDDEYEAQREANKTILDYKYKLQKAEQEISNLQASLSRSETQVIRYKSTAEAAEKAEAELKVERRKLQRENREASERLEELETSNNHLQKRLDKLKNAKSALLKDL